MTRFLHTADWQLGAHLAFLGDRAAPARRARQDAVGRLVDLALAEDAEFVVVAGDVFDTQDVAEGLVLELFETLSRMGERPVFLLPGNHDPYVPGSVWTRSLWEQAPSCVRPLLAPGEVEVSPGVVLFACPVLQKVSRVDPTAWIPRRQPGDDTLRIGLAHGALETLAHVRNFPIARSRASQSDLDYLALGDWHSPLAHGERTWYPGAHEPCSFRERDSGHALIVDLERGAPPRVQQHRTATLTWQTLRARVEDATDVERLRERVHPELESLVLDLKVESTSPEAAHALAGLEAELEENAFAARVDRTVRGFDPSSVQRIPLAAELDRQLTSALAQLEAAGDTEDRSGSRREMLLEARRQLEVLAETVLDGAEEAPA